MMKLKLLAAAGALLLTAASLTACGEPEENYTEEELPYGATLVEEVSRPITIAYDRRFLENELIEKIYTYYRSIQEQNGDDFTSLMFPFYHQYQLDEVYGGEVTDQEIVDNTHAAIQDYFGFDFDYSYIDITELITEEGWSADRDGIYLMMDALAEEKGEQKISEQTQALYEMKITRYVTEKGSGVTSETEYVLTDETLYAIQYQNEWYLMYA